MKRGIGGSRVVSSTALCVLATSIIGAALFGAASSSAATKPQKLVIYSLATQEQFLNHSDDRTRGKGSNPFGNFHDTTTPTQGGGSGPFPGDRAIFVFALYSDPNLKKNVGSATFTCQYGYNKNAFCDAAYLLSGNSLVGAGQFNFNAKTFALAITGGTGKYRGKTGDVSATPAAKHAQHLVFVLA